MRARDNPFASVRLHRLRYRLPGVTWDELLERLERLAWRAAIVGPHGSGKTSFLEALEPRLQQRGFATVILRLSEDRPRFEPGWLDGILARVTSRHILLLDGAEQMGRWAWHQFERRTRGAGGLIITTHRPGRLPTLLTCDTTPSLLGDVVQELLPNAPALSVATTRDLFFRHGGNLREALRELYDVYAQQQQFGERVEDERHVRPHPDPLPQERGSPRNTLRTASRLSR
jgi:hypothetical protein